CAWNAGRLPAPFPSAAAPRPRPWSWSPSSLTVPIAGAANACPTRVTAKPSTAWRRRSKGCAWRSAAALIANGCSLPWRPARRALACASWDLAATRAGRPIHELLGLPAPKAVTPAYTISLATPEAMAKAAAGAAERALLKIKLGAQGDPARIAAVRRAAPRAHLVVGANEGSAESGLATNLPPCAETAPT